MRNKRLEDVSKIFSSEVIKRVTDKLLPGENGCIEYDGYKNTDGYGTIFIGTRENHIDIGVHRWALGLAYGGVLFKPEYYACHRCDNPGCINPEHLFLGNGQDNNTDKSLKGRAPVVYGTAKLDWEIVDHIRMFPNIPAKFWTEQLGVSKSTISEIRNNKIWEERNREKSILP